MYNYEDMVIQNKITTYVYNILLLLSSQVDVLWIIK